MIDIPHCPRCDQPHKDVAFRRLTHPESLGVKGEMTHYAPCPANQEPILWRISVAKLSGIGMSEIGASYE